MENPSVDKTIESLEKQIIELREMYQAALISNQRLKAENFALRREVEDLTDDIIDLNAGEDR